MTRFEAIRAARRRENERAITQECLSANPSLDRLRTLHRERLVLRGVIPSRTELAIFVLILVALAASYCSTAHAQTLEELRSHCVSRVEETYHCTTACVNRLWPLIARCTNQQRAVDPGKLELCMKPIFRARFVNHTPELVDDPVAEAFACARR